MDDFEYYEIKQQKIENYTDITKHGKCLDEKNKNDSINISNRNDRNNLNCDIESSLGSMSLKENRCIENYTDCSKD